MIQLGAVALYSRTGVTRGCSKVSCSYGWNDDDDEDEDKDDYGVSSIIQLTQRETMVRLNRRHNRYF